MRYLFLVFCCVGITVLSAQTTPTHIHLSQGASWSVTYRPSIDLSKGTTLLWHYQLDTLQVADSLILTTDCHSQQSTKLQLPPLSADQPLALDLGVQLLQQLDKIPDSILWLTIQWSDDTINVDSLVLNFSNGGWLEDDNFWNTAAYYKLSLQKQWVYDSLDHWKTMTARTNTLLTKTTEKLEEEHTQIKSYETLFLAQPENVQALADTVRLLQAKMDQLFALFQNGSSPSKSDQKRIAHYTTQRNEAQIAYRKNSSEDAQEALDQWLFHQPVITQLEKQLQTIRMQLNQQVLKVAEFTNLERQTERDWLRFKERLKFSSKN